MLILTTCLQKFSSGFRNILKIFLLVHLRSLKFDLRFSLLHTLYFQVSQKSLSRQQYSTSGSRKSISYALLDATKQSSFLSAFDKSGFKSLDKFLVAYKPKRGKFAVFAGEMTTEEVERFIGSVLNGDVQFSKTRHKPLIK